MHPDVAGVGVKLDALDEQPGESALLLVRAFREDLGKGLAAFLDVGHVELRHLWLGSDRRLAGE
ncbi:MAG TPA: hypothetical protein VM221_04155 [Armatimonadota bacterium]|nr:hypothetical protein [Armatimonadota bacterium]